MHSAYAWRRVSSFRCRRGCPARMSRACVARVLACCPPNVWPTLACPDGNHAIPTPRSGLPPTRSLLIPRHCFTFFYAVKQFRVELVTCGALRVRPRPARRVDDRRGLVRRRRQAATDHRADACAPRGAVRLADGAVPETRLYGPYHHGGRSYYQWMARGTALVRDVLPLLEERAARRTRRLRGGALRGHVQPLRRRTSPASATGSGFLTDAVPGSAESGGDPEARVAALAERHGLPPDAATQLLAFHRLLVEDPLAPTAIRDPLKAVDDHLADSLVGLEFEPIRAAGTLADLGSGAGLPGLPLAIALPETSVALVESASRRMRVPRTGRGGVPCSERSSSSTHAPRLGPRAWRLSMSLPPGRWRRWRSSSSTRRRCWSSEARSWLGEAGAIRATRTRPAPRGGPARPRAGRNSPYAAISRRRSTDISTSCRRLWRHLQGFRVVPEWRSKRPLGAT